MAKNPFFQCNTSNFNAEQLELLEGYKRLNPIEIRVMLWDLVETNTPIPKELRPFLAEILSELPKRDIRPYRDLKLVEEMAFDIYSEDITIEQAAARLSVKYSIEPETISRIYKSGKYSKFKKMIKRGVKNQWY
ncbi:hypothetical protein [Rheinheimera aquimaris]|uniref:hypothetical protein n=1 Tax=Rheinheimera aquimaris TaxID=412437 RepID=UPI003A96F7D3